MTGMRFRPILAKELPNKYVWHRWNRLSFRI